MDAHRRYYQRRVRDVIAAGVAAGELTVPDPRLAAFAVCDMLNGLSNWFHPDGDLSLDEVADGYVDLIVGRMLGVVRGNSGSAAISAHGCRSRAPDGRPRGGRGVRRGYARRAVRRRCSSVRDGQVGVNRVSHRR